MQERSLIIRGQRSDDQDELFALVTQAAALHYALEVPYMAEETFRERYATPPANTYVLIAEEVLASARKRIVGAAWLHTFTRRRRHTAALSLMLLPELRLAGAAARLVEAACDLGDAWLGLRRIELTIYADDAGAEAFYGDFGFTRECVMRRYALRAGRYDDALLLARLHREDA